MFSKQILYFLKKKENSSSELIFKTKPAWLKNSLASKPQYQNKYNESIKNKEYVNKPLISTNKECITNTIHIIMSCHCHAHFQSYMCNVEGWWMRVPLRVSQQFSTVVRVRGCIYFLQFCYDFLWSIVWDLYLVL